MAPYQYEPLSSPGTQIRLLELLPGRGIIQCRLQVTDLNLAKGTYEPISYCWKPYSRKGWLVCTYREKREGKSVRVRVDGVDFHITQSLQAALRQMRQKTAVRVLWADAICINQADDGEKSAQVAIMGKIFQGGKQTLAWLGDADCWTERAFRTLKMQISEDSSSTELHQDPEDESENHLGDPEAKLLYSRYLWRARELCQDIFSYLSFRSILQRPYFERAWIVQEIVLSENVLVMCGKHRITGGELYNGLLEYEYNKGLPARAGLIGHSFGDLWDNRDLYCLDTIITKLSHTKTSDPRDKLYSALGLHQNCPRCGLMVVDYSKDVDEVFLEATKCLLWRSPFLDLLSMSYCTNRTDGLCVPSWVWNPQPRSTQFHLSWAEAGAERPFCATQGWHAPEPRFRGRRLGLLGYVFNKVKIIGKCLPAYPGYLTYGLILEGLLCYFSWLDVLGIYEPGITKAESDRLARVFRCTIKPLKEKFARTDRRDSNWFDDEDARDFESFHEEIVKRFGKFFFPGADKTSVRARLELWAALVSFHRHFIGSHMHAEPWTKFARGGKATFDRRFVRLEWGMFALCPRETMQNDRIVLLQGANVPLVLRPSGKNWLLVGECFKYGIMYGQLWDQEQCKMLWIE